MFVERFAENPLVTPADVRPWRADYEVTGTFNVGAVEYNGQILLLLRVAKSSDEQVAPILDAASGEVRCFRVKNDDPNVEILDYRGFNYKGKLHLTNISHLRLARSSDGVNF